MEELTIGVMKKWPDTKRLSTVRNLRRHIDTLMEEYENAIDGFNEYGMSAESDCVKKCLCDLWKHSEMLNELIRNADSDIKAAQDEGRWETDTKVETTTEVKTTTEEEPDEEDEEIECPDCGWKGKKCDSCPDCWYEF